MGDIDVGGGGGSTTTVPKLVTPTFRERKPEKNFTHLGDVLIGERGDVCGRSEPRSIGVDRAWPLTAVWAGSRDDALATAAYRMFICKMTPPDASSCDELRVYERDMRHGSLIYAPDGEENGRRKFAIFYVF